MFTVILGAADVIVSELTGNIGENWAAVQSAGLVILGALLAVAIVKKVRRFF